MSREPDRGLDELLAGEPDLEGTARQVREALQGPPADPAYRARLHNLLVAERSRVIEERRREQQPRRRRRRPWWRPDLGSVGGRLAPALAVVLAVVLAVAILPRLIAPGTAQVGISSPIAGQVAADPSAPIVVGFSRPMNHASVVAALRVSPATQIHTSWRGDDLVITPVNGLAPSVPYEVTVAADRARTSSGAAPSQNLRFWFGTGPAVAAPQALGPLGRTAQAFAAAQVGRDAAALRTLSAPQLSPVSLPRLSRAWVTWVDPTSPTTAVAEVQLMIDAGPGHPQSRVAAEELQLQRSGSNDQGGVVHSLAVGSFDDLAAGPHIVHVGVSSPDTLKVTYNCDMDAGSVAGSNQVLGAQGPVHVATSYDPATRTVTVRLPQGLSGSIQLTVSRGLRDIHDQHLAAPFQTTLTLP